MRILLTNDDGVHAAGIKILKQVLDDIAEVIVVAPLTERSTTGHTLTLDHPLRFVEVEKNVYGCSGYPADCTLMGIGFLLKNNPPDLVISGINRGANLGQDTYYSGTVAAAREATFHGFKSIAVSSVLDFQTKPRGEANYMTAALAIKNMVRKRIHKHISPMTLLNINVPDVNEHEIQGIEVGSLGFRKYSEDINEREDFRGRNYYWIGGVYKGYEQTEGTDCLIVDQNKISLTPIQLLNRGTDKLIEQWREIIKEL